jgi:hypothetical protein
VVQRDATERVAGDFLAFYERYLTPRFEAAAE